MGESKLGTEEVWVVIPGFPNYEVSNMGRVCNVKRGYDLTQRVDKNGYHNVALFSKGIRGDFGVHRLVAQAFFVDFGSSVEVIHINDDRSENTVRNLRLGPPLKIRVRIKETGQEFDSISACSAFLGGKPSSVHNVLRGTHKSYRGYTFEVVDRMVSK